MLLAATLALLGVGVAHTQAQEPVEYPLEVHLFPDARVAGVITLSFYGAPGTPVTFYERVGVTRELLGTRTAATGLATVLSDAVTWRCDRLVRRFVAVTTTPDGREATAAYDVRTPSCKTRLELVTPRHVARGKVGRVRVVDRWNNGDIAPQLCLEAPREKRDCTTLKFARAVAVITHRFRPEKSGRWRAELRFRGRTTRRSIAVGKGRARSRPPLTVLATGDSTMQGIDSYLADELAEAATVKSDLHPGTGLVKPDGPWEKLAPFQMRVAKPDVTVMSIGAADDFPLRAFDQTVHQCCDDAWVLEYAGRVRQTMQTYLRDGRARVVWLTLPIPRGERPFVAASINEAVIRASLGLRGVTVLRMDQVFTPDGHREVMPYRGRNVRIFRTDGVHLTITGTAIAARLVADALRRR
jgi:hypothetical protein